MNDKPWITSQIDIDWDKFLRRREFIIEAVGKPDFNYLVLPEVQALLDRIENMDDLLIASTLWYTGARVTEILTLKPKDFSLEEGDAFVSLPTIKQRSKKKVRPVRRIINLGDPHFISMVRRYIATFNLKKGDLLFGNFTRSKVRHRLIKFGEDANLPIRVNPHTLRHSFAINLLLHGKELEQVQALLGHSDKRSTEVYLKVLGSDMAHHSSGVPFRMTK